MEQRIRFNDILNYEQWMGESNTEPSMTIPDQTLGMREILSRFSRGLSIDTKPTYFDEGNETPDFSRMDLAEIEDYKLQLNETIHRLNVELQNTENAQEVTQIEKEG